MIAIGVICSIIGLGTLCGLLFTFATLAFPVFVAVSIGIWLSTNGMASLAAVLLGAIAGTVTLGIGQLVFVIARPIWLRLLVGIVYVVPAGIAGYYAASASRNLVRPPRCGRSQLPSSALRLLESRRLPGLRH